MSGELLDLLDAPDRSARRRRGRSAGLALLGVVLLGSLLAGGWWGVGWLRDADLRGALAGSAAVLDTTVRPVVAAADATEALQVLPVLDGARDELARQERRVAGRGGAPGRRVRAELAAQQDVLAALAALSGLRTGPLQAWGPARGALARALRAERSARDELATDRPAAAAQLADLDVLGPALDRLAAPVLARAADAELTRLRGVLRDVRRTADLRAAAGVAARQAAGVAATAQAAPEVPDALTRVATAVGALAGLTQLSGQDASAWPAERTRLDGALGDAGAVAQADDVVGAAVQATELWRGDADAARAARDADVAALAGYASSVRGLLGGLGALDAALPGLVDGASVDAEAVAAQGPPRRSAATALAGLTPPDLLGTEHAALVTAVARGAALVAVLGGDEAAVPQCADSCTGTRATAVARVVDDRRAAAADWSAAVVRATALLAGRPLPPPPDL